MQCPNDADTSIVKETMETVEHSDVTVFSDDTDVLCLLVHHIEKCPTDHNVYLANMTQKNNKQREYISVKDVIEESGDHIVDYLLFAHAFTVCDTTSATHKFGKTGLFKKLSTSSSLRKTATTFYEDKLPEEVGNACIQPFELLHSPSESLPQIRKTKYEQMIISDRSAIDPSLLPPSPRAAFYHG